MSALQDVRTLLSFKRILTFDKDYKRFAGLYLVRKGLSVYGFYRRVPDNQMWKENMWVARFDKNKVTFNTHEEHGHVWSIERLIESMCYGNMKITFKRHNITFDEMVEDEDSRWRQQCPPYYVYKDEDVKEETPFFSGMVIDYNGRCLNRDSEAGKEKMDAFKKYKDLMRQRTNRMSRNRRLEKKAIAAAKLAKHTGDWSNVNPQDVFTIKNVSQRRDYLEHYSVNEIVESMNPKTIDEQNYNNSKYELITFEIDPVEKALAYYLKMTNPSTGEIHLEGVAPPGRWDGIEDKTVEAALMWRDGEKMFVEVESNTSTGTVAEKVKVSYNAPVAIT